MRDPAQYLGYDVVLANYGYTDKTGRLASEVQDAIYSDPMYGPLHDRDRHLAGLEYEVVLEFRLKDMGSF